MENSDEDSLIQLYIDASTQYISTFLNNPSFAHNAAIKAAALLIIGDLYENREAGSEKEVKKNPAVMSLLHPYRKEIGI